MPEALTVCKAVNASGILLPKRLFEEMGVEAGDAVQKMIPEQVAFSAAKDLFWLPSKLFTPRGELR